MSIRDTEAAWLAGFLEGEGTFQVVETRKTGSGPIYEAQIAATNTAYAALERCHEIAGGWLYGPIGRGNAKWKPAYRWTLRGKALGPVLRALIPHLVAKREPALILLCLREEITVGANVNEWGRKPLGADVLARRTDYKMAMHALNHRGALPTPQEQTEALARIHPQLEAIAATVA